MSQIYLNRALALAGVFQVAHSVRMLATLGRFDATRCSVLLNSLFMQSPNSVEEVYSNNIESMKEGHELVAAYFSSKNQQSNLSPDTIRYFLSLVMLSIKLSKDSSMLSQLDQGMKNCRRQKDHFDVTHETLLSALAELYKESLSTYSFRIHVTGKPEMLNSPLNVERIRALLLAGVRSGLLWRQLGGSRWHLVFNKKRLANAAQERLASMSLNQQPQ